jgi:hypothetical protein
VNANASPANSIRCPTCGAGQRPSVECRRCKCDLSLVVAVRNHADDVHSDCLRQLGAGEYRDALRSALVRYELSPDETSRRLLAVTYLCLGRYQAALDLRDDS